MAVSQGLPGRIFKFLIAAVSLFGLSARFIESGSLATGLNLLSYYTFQSNIIVVVVCLIGALSRGRGSELRSVLRGGATLWILVTGLVYHFMLSSHYQWTGLFVYSNLAMHYVTPIAFVIDWLLFESKGLLRPAWPLYWLVYPLLYLVGSELRGAIDGFYPYWFVNPNRPYPKGTGSLGLMLLIILALFLFFAALGYAIFFLDRGLGKRGKSILPRPG